MPSPSPQCWCYLEGSQLTYIYVCACVLVRVLSGKKEKKKIMLHVRKKKRNKLASKELRLFIRRLSSISRELKEVKGEGEKKINRERKECNIYCRPQTDYFVVSQLFDVARHAYIYIYIYHPSVLTARISFTTRCNPSSVFVSPPESTQCPDKTDECKFFMISQD